MTDSSTHIVSPDDPNLTDLCTHIREIGTDGSNWPKEKLELISEAGVYRWFIPESLGGLGWSSADVVSGYIQLSSACLNSTFIVTQRVAALKRIAMSENSALKTSLIPGLLDGSSPATVGISHLTTSRQHLKKPVLLATENENGYLAEGFSPWVTGGIGAKFLVMGAQLENGSQILFAIPSDTTGIVIEPGFELVGLTESHTGRVTCDKVQVSQEQVLAGPVENVLANMGTATGGFQTSALAIGLSKSAIDFIKQESERRPELTEKVVALQNQFDELESRVLSLASGIDVCSKEELRSDANSLVLRATQAALVAAKGAGYVSSHPVGRWCREALFFLVWSCPQAVRDANLCELAGIEL